MGLILRTRKVMNFVLFGRILERFSKRLTSWFSGRQTSWIPYYFCCMAFCLCLKKQTPIHYFYEWFPSGIFGFASHFFLLFFVLFSLFDDSFDRDWNNKTKQNIKRICLDLNKELTPNINLYFCQGVVGTLKTLRSRKCFVVLGYGNWQSNVLQILYK